jgi:hypothetical protein
MFKGKLKMHVLMANLKKIKKYKLAFLKTIELQTSRKEYCLEKLDQKIDGMQKKIIFLIL